MGEARGRTPSEESKDLHEKSQHSGESPLKKPHDNKLQSMIRPLGEARERTTLEESEDSRQKSEHSGESLLKKPHDDSIGL